MSQNRCIINLFYFQAELFRLFFNVFPFQQWDFLKLLLRGRGILVQLKFSGFLNQRLNLCIREALFIFSQLFPQLFIFDGR